MKKPNDAAGFGRWPFILPARSRIWAVGSTSGLSIPRLQTSRTSGKARAAGEDRRFAKWEKKGSAGLGEWENVAKGRPPQYLGKGGVGRETNDQRQGFEALGWTPDEVTISTALKEAAVSIR